MESVITALAQFGVPTLVLGIVLWVQREDRRACREDATRMWETITRLALHMPAAAGKGGDNAATK